MAIDNGPADEIDIRVRALQPGRELRSEHAVVVATIWCEAGDTVRARLEHVPTGTTSYVQGNASLLAFGKELGLSASPFPPAE